MVKTFKIYSHCNYQVYYTILLTIIIMLFIRSPELIHCITVSLYSLTNIFHFLHPQPLLTTIIFSVTKSLAFLDSTHECYNVIFVSFVPWICCLLVHLVVVVFSSLSSKLNKTDKYLVSVLQVSPRKVRIDLHNNLWIRFAVFHLELETNIPCWEPWLPPR